MTGRSSHSRLFRRIAEVQDRYHSLIECEAFIDHIESVRSALLAMMPSDHKCALLRLRRNVKE